MQYTMCLTMTQKTYVSILALLLLIPSLASSQSPPSNSSGYIIHCGTLIDGVSAQPRKNVQVVVEGNKIREVRESSGLVTAGLYPPVGLAQYTCLPGLIDTHTHVLLQGDIIVDYDEQLLKESTAYRAIRATVSAKNALQFGFTSIRDLETEGAGYADVDLRNAIDRGIVPGPRM